MDRREVNMALGGVSLFRNMTITIIPETNKNSSGQHPSLVPLFKDLAYS